MAAEIGCVGKTCVRYDQAAIGSGHSRRWIDWVLKADGHSLDRETRTMDRSNDLSDFMTAKGVERSSVTGLANNDRCEADAEDQRVLISDPELLLELALIAPISVHPEGD